MISLNATESYWKEDAIRSYVHNSELQRRWAMAFLAPHLKKLSGHEQILDIGCGDGKISADISTFVPNGSVVGIDPSTDMISWALAQYDKKEYPNLSFNLGSFLSPETEGSFDLVVSFCAMQHCSDPRQAFKEIHRLLKPGGKLLLLVPSSKNPAWRSAKVDISQRPMWHQYWKDHVPRIFFDSEQYKEILSENHFEVLSIEDVSTTDPFVDKQELISWLIGTFPPLIPKNLVDQFYSEIIEGYLQRKPDALSSNGAINVSFDSIRIVARSQ